MSKEEESLDIIVKLCYLDSSFYFKYPSADGHFDALFWANIMEICREIAESDTKIFCLSQVPDLE